MKSLSAEDWQYTILYTQSVSFCTKPHQSAYEKGQESLGLNRHTDLSIGRTNHLRIPRQMTKWERHAARHLPFCFHKNTNRFRFYKSWINDDSHRQRIM